MPLCTIPWAVREQWALGDIAPPGVDVLHDRSYCSSLVALLGEEGEEAADATATTANAAAANATANAAELAASGVTGASGLGDCFRSVLVIGGCANHTTASMFQCDEDGGTCGCCTPTAHIRNRDGVNFGSAVYGYGNNGDAMTTPPTYCIFGSTTFYPSRLGGDAAHACECGLCDTCSEGSHGPWTGPARSPWRQALADAFAADNAGTSPRYDPVGTCLCNSLDGFDECPLVESMGSVGAAHGGAVATAALVLLGTALW